MTSFLDELLETQKSRNDLMKWKLVVVSALGAAGLGFVENKSGLNLHLIIIMIPIACVYIDLLCRNLSVRRKRIIYFMADLKDDNFETDIKYAQFYRNIKKESGRSLESFAVLWSTILISLGVILIGFFLKDIASMKVLFISIGIIVIFLSWFVERRFQFENRTIEKINTKSNS